MKKGIRMYNLYPKLVGSMENWMEHFDRIKNMNFNWIYVNPFHAPGFSGSDYAIKDYYLYHPLFVKGEMDFSDLEGQREQGDKLLKKVCKTAESKGMNMVMDLVINHTAIDSPLTKEHPEWYMKDENGNIKKPGAMDGNEWIEWGDLAQIDNENSPKKEELWDYWLDMIMYYADLGVRGFRCDAAYHVPTELWKFLTSMVKSKYPDVIFIAETLGCQPAQLMETAEAGFDYVMNSFKWWDLKADYFLKDYKDWAGQYPSMTFPSNHDTKRYAEEVNGNSKLAVEKYATCSYFSSSIAMTYGFEYGFEKQIDVVKTNPNWVEEKKYDISDEISKINEIKSNYKVLQEDNMIDMYTFDNNDIYGFTKKSLDGSEKIFVITNKSATETHHIYVNDIYSVLGSNNVEDISHGHRMSEVLQNLEYGLAPGEVKLFYAKL
ncbi:MAG: alpha-amylase family glycosyl hydrolase [Fusobacteriota bacterium]